MTDKYDNLVKLLLGVVLVLFLVAIVYVAFWPTKAKADNYIRAGVVNSQYQINSPFNSIFDDSATGLSLAMGHRWGGVWNWGAEVETVNFGAGQKAFGGVQTDINANALAAWATLEHVLIPGPMPLMWNARLGVANVESTAHVQAGPFSVAGVESNLGLAAGLGLTWYPWPTVGVTLDVRQYRGDVRIGAANIDTDPRTLTAGVLVSF